MLLSRVLYFGGLLAYAVALGWSIAGFWARVAISGRPPISNMYESVIWVAFMTAVFGLILELVYRQGVIALAGGLVSTLGLVLADQLPLTLDPKISPLVAVLRSNYWLIIHVITIVSSYAAFALAWGLGNLNLGMILFSPQRGDLIKTLSHFCYRAIQIGVIMLFLGTMLGGFWAAESWGRFWGWDPKEVWALIAFLCYIIPLHARYVGWVKDFGLAVCSVVCFSAIVMAWYGVNFVLGAGLHTYGFGGGDNAWMAWGVLLNLDLVLAGALGFMHFRHVAPVAAAE
jgi:ABC-type transport system involved in cytochrome c biogenesis permease subunit